MPKPENLIGQGFDKHPERINKKGRPPVQSLKAILKKLIDSQAPKAIIDLAYVQKLTTKKKLSYNEVLALRLATAALVEGDISAIKEIFDRLEGKAEQAVKYSGEMEIRNWQIIPKTKDAGESGDGSQ